jgi:hypothetical protein
MAYAAVSRDRLRGADELVKEAVEVAEANYNFDRENRIEGIRDLQFLAGDQWDPRDRRQREADDRPVITVNRLIQPVKLVANQVRFSVPGVKCVPVDRDADAGTAWVLAGLMRQIQRMSMATWVYSVATGHAAACGIGHFRILTDYVDDDVFDQEIKIKLIPHPFSVLWDAGAEEPDRSDAMNCLVLEFVPTAEFKKRYPGAAAVDFQGSQTFNPGGNFQWFRPDFVVVAEFWKKVPYERKLGQLADGRVIDLTNVVQLNPAIQVVRERTVQSFCVEQMLVSGREVLKGPHKWAGRYIPIVPIIGNEIPQEHTVVRHGIVRFARDPQKMYNYWRSQSAEWIGQAAKSPWLVALEQIANYKDVWDTANQAPRPYLPYDFMPENPQLKPERMRAPEPPAALWQEGTIASDEVKVTTGLYNPSLGAQGNEVSGRAIAERQSQADLANFEFTHNLGISLNHTGRILIDLAPKVYDTSRTVRILDEFEKEHFVPINSVAYQEDGEAVLVHDITAGKYDVSMKIGPSYLTRREEAASQMVEFLKLNPEAFSIIGDIVAEEQDWPGAAKIGKRLKRAVPPQILGDDADEPPPPPDPVQVEGVKQEIREKKASADKKEAEAREADANARLAEAKARRETIEAGQRDAVDPREQQREDEKHAADLAKRGAETELVRARTEGERRAQDDKGRKADADDELTRSKAMHERVKARVDVHNATKPEPKKPKGEK